MITSLVFADAHVESDDVLRFEKLGKLIIDRKPQHIYDLGDTVSLSAISHWDMSKRLKMEGKRYKNDVTNGKLAYDTLFKPLESVQHSQKRNKQKVYSPTFEKLDGNHEGWVDTYLEQNPELLGALSLAQDLGLAKRGVPVYPYRSRIVRNGINYMHCPLAGNNQPISGLHIPHKTLQRFNSHVIMGHYHRSEVASIKRTDSPNTTRSIICPAFFSGQPHYLSPNAPCVIDAGVLLIHQDENTLWPRIEEITMEQLYAEY